MLKLKNLFLILFGALLVSCSHYAKHETNSYREMASEKMTGNETGNPLMSSCFGDIEKELNTITISEKFKVKLERSSDYLLELDARDACGSRIEAFGGHCLYTKPYKNSGSKNFIAEATPYITEKFLTNYRKHIVCTKISACEQRAALDENVSANTLDKIHRIYENNKCDTLTVDVIENKIVKEIKEVVPNKNPAPNPITVVTQQPAVNNFSGAAPAKDPNAQFCQLRSTQGKCLELNGVCEWVAPTTGYCKARVGSTDPNAKFCQLRSPQSKCQELSGVCEWAQESSGYCRAR